MAIKNYKISVNGKSYDVEVEEITSYPETMTTTSAPSGEKKVSNSASHSISSTSASAEEVKAPLQGIILGVAVKSGDSVKKGDLLLKIEAMKMENEVLSPKDGTISSVFVNDGDRVSTGDSLVSIK